MNKFRNRKTGGFDSKKEFNRAQELRLLEKAGAISGLEFQITFVLIPKQVDDKGKTIERACSYVADFQYVEDGRIVVEDCKGFRTPDYILKRKMMLYFYKIRIRET